MTEDKKLRIIIIGSGLAGLTAARILREHHDVTVFERGSASVATGGQGIAIGPNGMKILNTLGYSAELAGGVPLRSMRSYDSQGNLQDETHWDLQTRFGAETLGHLRSDFWDELFRLATAPSVELGIKGLPAKVLFESTVVNVDPIEGVVTLSDGSTAAGDVVILADGIHSKLRSSIVDVKPEPKKTGLTCHRVAISASEADQALGSLPIPLWWQRTNRENCMFFINGPDRSNRFVLAYPLRNQTYYNLSCMMKTEVSRKDTTESWDANADLGNIVGHFGYNEALKRILSVATVVKTWELQDLDPLPTWTRGRAIIIGDAAHAMTPMQAQGANMSIEDAEAFRLLFPRTQREDVPGVLQRIDRIRRPRAAESLRRTRETHGNLSAAERLNANFDFFMGYCGVFSVLDA
ncbi:FAD binding domain protein [Periconia macrospinosa]|uniref:FAD binding domain protein n=1 Tax=Periconia macrospinosa TaxID=97972 RepID=A0A2V1DD82_9PLEO|nr:FAD binding domain protein [Periconia macrospinosa]